MTNDWYSDPLLWVGKEFTPYGFAEGRTAYVYSVEGNIVSFGWTPERGWNVFTTTPDNFRRDWEPKREKIDAE